MSEKKCACESEGVPVYAHAHQKSPVCLPRCSASVVYSGVPFGSND